MTERTLAERLRTIEAHAGNWDDDTRLLGNLTALEIGETCEQAAAALEELAALEQTSADLCESCGWRMVFPGEPCANCERYALRERLEKLEAGLLDASQMILSLRLAFDRGDSRYDECVEAAVKFDALATPAPAPQQGGEG